MMHTRLIACLAVVLFVSIPLSLAAQQPHTHSLDLGPELSLEKLLEFADENAPRIAEARKRVALGDAAVEGASVVQRFNPELEGKVGVGLSDTGEQFEVALTQRLEISGARGLRIKAADRKRATLAMRLEASRVRVRQDVTRLFRQALLEHEQARAENEVLSFTQELLEKVRTRFEAGEEPRTSVIVTRVEVAAAQQRLVRARNAYRNTLGELAAAIGWKGDKPPRPIGVLGSARTIPAVEDLVARAHTDDPELAILNARLQHEKADVAAQKRTAWPNPKVGIGYENEGIGEQAAEHNLLFFVGIPLPVWQRNQEGVATASARSAIVTTEIATRKQELNTRIATESAALQSVYEQVQIYENEVLPALEEQLEMLQEGFELGELSLLDVMNARDRLLDVQRQYLTLRHEYLDALGELETLLGAPLK